MNMAESKETFANGMSFVENELDRLLNLDPEQVEVEYGGPERLQDVVDLTKKCLEELQEIKEHIFGGDEDE
jgi:hypothetical protein